MDDRELKGRELWGVKSYAHGLVLLLLANVLFVMSQPPFKVWLWINGIGFAAILLGRWLVTGHVFQVGVSDQLKRRSKK